ncbi:MULTISPECIES: hypothetical protein [Sinobaca]|nr:MULTISPECIES: hypothetical protein [Sinobaca]
MAAGVLLELGIAEKVEEAEALVRQARSEAVLDRHAREALEKLYK